MKPVCGSLFDLFSNLLSLVFFLNCGYLICLTYKNNQNTMKEQSAKRQKDLSGSHSWTSLIRIKPFFFANAYSIYYSHIYNKTDRKVKPTIVNDYCTFGASITEVQIRYKWSSRMETRTQGQKNTLSVICNSVSRWSKNLFETHLFGFHFYVTLWTVNNASLF